jgi:hypothetical protein
MEETLKSLGGVMSELKNFSELVPEADDFFTGTYMVPSELVEQASILPATISRNFNNLVNREKGESSVLSKEQKDHLFIKVVTNTANHINIGNVLRLEAFLKYYCPLVVSSGVKNLTIDKLNEHGKSFIQAVEAFKTNCKRLGLIYDEIKLFNESVEDMNTRERRMVRVYDKIDSLPSIIYSREITKPLAIGFSDRSRELWDKIVDVDQWGYTYKDSGQSLQSKVWSARAGFLQNAGIR